MVSTRTGKTTYNPDGEVEQQRSARARRTSDKENGSATQPPASRPNGARRGKAAAAPAADTEVEPTTPTSDKRSKRGRSGGVLMTPLQEQDTASPATHAHEQQQQLQEAAHAPLPDNSPSPQPKKARTVRQELEAAAMPTPRNQPRQRRQGAAARRMSNPISWLPSAVFTVLAALFVAVLLSPDLRQHAHQRYEIASGLAMEYAKQAQSLASTHAAALQKLAQVRRQQLLQAASPLLARAQACASDTADAAAAALSKAKGRMAAALGNKPLPAKDSQEAAASAGAAESPAAAVPFVAAAKLAELLPPGAAWEAVAGDMAEKVNSHGPSRNKGVALLLGCNSGADCAAAADALKASAFPCKLHVHSSEVGTAGELQAQLAPFLGRCPAGLVLLEGVEQLRLAAVPALNNALSELGGFEHGSHVDATQATYALLLQLPSGAEDTAAAAEGKGDEADGQPESVAAAAERRIKAAFFGGLAEQATSTAAEDGGDDANAGAKEAAAALMRALRRRIEFAAPLRSLGRDTVAAA